MLSVGVNGYGTIGKRVADAVEAQSDMQIEGVAKTSPSAEAAVARERGYLLYTPDESGLTALRDGGFEPAGLVEDLVERSDVIVDATPGGVGETYLPLYRDLETPAIFQGKESDEMVDSSFCARANFDECVGAEYLRVVSCNTTGLGRALAPLAERHAIDTVRATLVRRGGDPSQTDRGPINDILPDPVTLPSHHGPDLQTILPDIDINTLALRVPSTLMHVHAVNVTMAEPPTRRDIAEMYENERRIFLVPDHLSLDGTATLAEYARDRGRSRGDMWESCMWNASLTVEDRDLYFFQAIHQESNVVPENVDAIRAIAETADAQESMRLTEDRLGIGEWPIPHPEATQTVSAGE